MASRLRDRIPRTPPNPSPNLLLPNNNLPQPEQTGQLPSSLHIRPALLRHDNAALPQARIRDTLHPPLLKRNNARVQYLQELRTLLASRWFEYRSLYILACRVVSDVHRSVYVGHIPSNCALRHWRARQSIHAHHVDESAQPRREREKHTREWFVQCRSSNMSQLLLRDARLDRDMVGKQELEHRSVCGHCCGPNGCVGEEEGAEI